MFAGARRPVRSAMHQCRRRIRCRNVAQHGAARPQASFGRARRPQTIPRARTSGPPSIGAEGFLTRFALIDARRAPCANRAAGSPACTTFVNAVWPRRRLQWRRVPRSIRCGDGLAGNARGSRAACSSSSRAEWRLAHRRLLQREPEFDACRHRRARCTLDGQPLAGDRRHGRARRFHAERQSSSSSAATRARRVSPGCSRPASAVGSSPSRAFGRGRRVVPGHRASLAARARTPKARDRRPHPRSRARASNAAGARGRFIWSVTHGRRARI